MDDFIPYQIRSKREPDFRVAYRIFNKEEGGRNSLPFQGIRWDFWYSHKDHKPNSLFCIWPEFENENGEVIINSEIKVPKEGFARMWIINKDLIEYHRGKIQLGTVGFFKEGYFTTGECKVIELMNLK